MTRKMYHTQEKWANRLTAPIICTRSDAWLGNGYYFWEEKVDAIIWGHKSKNATGYFEIYSADIDLSNVFDTVFNREHYEAWKAKLEQVALLLQKNSRGKKPTIQLVNIFLKKEGVFTAANFDGVLFQDNTDNPRRLQIEKFEYKKRIQLAAFTTRIISNFSFAEEKLCR